MMKSINRIFPLLAFFVASTFFMGCNKYEEGPKVSLRSRDERVSNVWKIEEYTINGVAVVMDDSTANARYEFTKERVYNLYDSRDAANKSVGKWFFLDDNETLGLNNRGTGFGNATIINNGSYKITKLEEESLWFERETEQGKDMVKLQPE